MTFYFPVKQIAVVVYFIFSTTDIATNNQLRKIWTNFSLTILLGEIGEIGSLKKIAEISLRR